MAITIENSDLFDDIKGKVKSFHLESSFQNKNSDAERVVLKGKVNGYPVEILLDGSQVYNMEAYDFSKFPPEIEELKTDVFNIINRHYNSNY
jgi:hypothetical protein